MREALEEPRFARRALIVEGDEAWRSTLCESLRRSGFTIAAVGSEAEAAAALGSSSFDLVLADERLPDGDGLDLLRAEVPVIVLLARPDEEATREALRAGALDVVVKGENDALGLGIRIGRASCRERV